LNNNEYWNLLLLESIYTTIILYIIMRSRKFVTNWNLRQFSQLSQQLKYCATFFEFMQNWAKAATFGTKTNMNLPKTKCFYLPKMQKLDFKKNFSIKKMLHILTITTPFLVFAMIAANFFNLFSRSSEGPSRRSR